jgi:mRNA interferase RelE/StbE
MPWRVEFLRSAAQQFEAFDPDLQRRIAEHIDRLRDDPFFAGTKRLEGYSRLRRCRVGDYRVVYTIEADVVLIVRIGTRAEIYRRLERALRQLRNRQGHVVTEYTPRTF